MALPADPLWSVDGVLGPRPLGPRALDLLDLAGAIYRVESDIPRRPTNPAIAWEIAAPVRDVSFWTRDGGPLLASVLAFLNRAQWSFTFTARTGAPDLARPKTSDTRQVDRIMLFSGGMDSTCGAGVHRLRGRAPRETQLVSFYTRQKDVQRTLASELGYDAPTQWRLAGRRGKEGMNLIRSLMFLSIAAATAQTYGASEIVQYENGVLAAAIPPSGNFVPTRHAHPELHRRLQQLFAAVFDRPIAIRNPFALLTKREVVARFTSSVGDMLAESLLSRTETCWRFWQAHVGGEPKEPGQHCGVCTPCIVRRTARPREAASNPRTSWKGYAYDLLRADARGHEKLGRTFRAYLELVDIAMTSDSDRALIRELPADARAVIGGVTGPGVAETAGLLRRFAEEFCDTFDITVSEVRR